MKKKPVGQDTVPINPTPPSSPQPLTDVTVEAHQSSEKHGAFSTDGEILDHPSESISLDESNQEPSTSTEKNVPVPNQEVGGDIIVNSTTESHTSNSATDLQKGFKRLAIPYRSIDVILNTLRPYHDLPKSHKTLMGKQKKYNTETFTPDRFGHKAEFVYFGLAENLEKIVNPELHKDRKLKLQINFDGLSLFKSSRREFWPITSKIYVDGNPYTPFVVAVHSIDIENEYWDVEIMAFVCDTPVRAYAKCTQGHTGFHACDHCLIVGLRVDGTTICPVSAAEMRTDA
ncbi:hypothetical protein QAD02_023046 [Eretmocerus hayati]|uniref:Uncharacterized protein n=1 Tax=Eretmocerus hayati TaxID=131215 RepID=A0ACC2PY36_9HYME|nr:hypothetical protein QAD02_023046 [Eretmocerus hayati]